MVSPVGPRVDFVANQWQNSGKNWSSITNVTHPAFLSHPPNTYLWLTFLWDHSWCLVFVCGNYVGMRFQQVQYLLELDFFYTKKCLELLQRFGEPPEGMVNIQDEMDAEMLTLLVSKWSQATHEFPSISFSTFEVYMIWTCNFYPPQIPPQWKLGKQKCTLQTVLEFRGLKHLDDRHTHIFKDVVVGYVHSHWLA